MNDTLNRIKVLALNDDNHETVYITLNEYYFNIVDFATKCLLKPHDCTYDVRAIYICDYPEVLENLLGETEFIKGFDLLACISRPAQLFFQDKKKWAERQKAFELFWENGEKWRYA